MFKAFNLGKVVRRTVRPVAEYFRPSEWTSICRLNGRGNDEISIQVICNNAQEYSRAKTYATKEPETLEWIRRYTSPGDVLWDVGANIGLYSLFAAKLGCDVVAIEPHLPTANKLLKNVVANGLCNQVKIIPICLLDGERFGGYYVSSHEPGSSIHTFSDKPNRGGAVSICFPGHTVVAKYGHHVFATTADRLTREWNFPEPDHVKIDVDGHESDVLNGMEGILEAATNTSRGLDTFPYAGKLKSILVEVHDDCMEDMKSFMIHHGFHVDDSFTETSRSRENRRAFHEGGRWGGHGNMVFLKQ